MVANGVEENPHLNDPKRIFWIRSLHLYTQTSLKGLKGTQIALYRADSFWPCIAWYYMRCMFRECSQNCPLDYEQIITTLYSLTALHILHEQRGLIMKHMISTIWAVFISPVAEWQYGSIWDYIFTKLLGVIYIYSGLSMIIIIHYMISMGMSWAGHLWRWSRGTARPTRARELAASCGARQVSDLKFDYRDLESMACVIRWLSCFSVECDVTFLYKPCVWFRRLLLGDRACLWKLRISEPRVREEY
jgi:hypothetical protein